jgi:hypothetical protein
MLSRSTSNIKNLALLFIVALCACATATAQQGSCSLKIEQLKDAPELLGFHLGMTFDEVKARVPLAQFGNADQFGVVKTTINPHFDTRFDQKAFAGIRTISFDFLDGKLVTLWIGYEETFKWPTMDEFVPNFSKSLNLPADWPPKRPGRQLTCDGFSVFASIIAAGPSIRITNEDAENLIATRREEAAQAAEAQVIGDSRTKSYYLSDCSAREDVPAATRVVFKDKDEAEKAGYKLAKDCQL